VTFFPGIIYSDVGTSPLYVLKFVDELSDLTYTLLTSALAVSGLLRVLLRQRRTLSGAFLLLFGP
jgi:K+ transporter